MQKLAVVLVSGGLDSATTLAIAKKMEFTPYAMTFSYGQRHHVELDAAKRVIEMLGAKNHKIVNIDLRTFGGSSLTSDMDVPKDQIDINGNHITVYDDIVPTYVPARNTIFLSYALAYAEVIGAFDIFIGANIYDYSNYPDCRPEYIKAFESLANLATVKGMRGGQFKIHAPLLYMSKAQIIERAQELYVDLAQTHSCYDPILGLACGHCDSCLFRKKGFMEAGIPDCTRYAMI